MAFNATSRAIKQVWCQVTTCEFEHECIGHDDYDNCRDPDHFITHLCRGHMPFHEGQAHNVANFLVTALNYTRQKNAFDFTERVEQLAEHHRLPIVPAPRRYLKAKQQRRDSEPETRHSRRPQPNSFKNYPAEYPKLPAKERVQESSGPKGDSNPESQIPVHVKALVAPVTLAELKKPYLDDLVIYSPNTEAPCLPKPLSQGRLNKRIAHWRKLGHPADVIDHLTGIEHAKKRAWDQMMADRRRAREEDRENNVGVVRFRNPAAASSNNEPMDVTPADSAAADIVAAAAAAAGLD